MAILNFLQFHRSKTTSQSQYITNGMAASPRLTIPISPWHILAWLDDPRSRWNHKGIPQSMIPPWIKLAFINSGQYKKELHWNPGVFCFSQPNCPASCVPRLNTLKHQSYGARFQTDVSVFASTRTTTCNWKFIAAITWRKNCGSWNMLHLPSLPVHLHSN